MAFTVPVDRTALTGRPASRGNWTATNRRTSAASMPTSPSCIFMQVDVLAGALARFEAWHDALPGCHRISGQADRAGTGPRGRGVSPAAPSHQGPVEYIRVLMIWSSGP